MRGQFVSPAVNASVPPEGDLGWHAHDTIASATITVTAHRSTAPGSGREDLSLLLLEFGLSDNTLIAKFRKLGELIGGSCAAT